VSNTGLGSIILDHVGSRSVQQSKTRLCDSGRVWPALASVNWLFCFSLLWVGVPPSQPQTDHIQDSHFQKQSCSHAVGHGVTEARHT
jgi:hypothetical protein